MFSLNGKTALVTGATGGIGQEIARVLHKAGATIVISGTKEEKLKNLKDELGERVFIAPCNLVDPESVKQLIPTALGSLQHLDILVCNAGVTKDTLAMRMSDQDFDDVLNVNLKSTFLLNRDAIKHMIKNKSGRIINISSIVACTGNPGQANYSASKAGMIGMSKSLAREVATRGITINCIAPGFIETPMTDVLTEDQKNMIKKNIPSQELGTPADIAYAALYLASNESRYVTGQTLHVNGGMCMV